MRGKIELKLQAVPKTMLISIRARYLETKKGNGTITDPKSIEILDQIDYDFSGEKEASVGAAIGTSIRTEIIDEQTFATTPGAGQLEINSFYCKR